MKGTFLPRRSACFFFYIIDLVAHACWEAYHLVFKLQFFKDPFPS